MYAKRKSKVIWFQNIFLNSLIKILNSFELFCSTITDTKWFWADLLILNQQIVKFQQINKSRISNKQKFILWKRILPILGIKLFETRNKNRVLNVLSSLREFCK